MRTHYIQGVDHVQLPVSDLKKAIQWYSEVLGLEVKSVHKHAAWLRFAKGPFLMLHHSNKETKVQWLSEEDFPMPAFMFITENMVQLKQQLDKNNTFIRMYQDEGFGWVIKFVDPFGNELGAYRPN
ncbi:VOC family protein [Paenibacillus sepulcri]|uniref:VOC family protein n=1 Tax=Paenibacillus sepulcri TaxID=359917 RepID=A0ABS7C811_9BACL|nr:VOC family protein [Paenibacillus sepulcri]